MSDPRQIVIDNQDPIVQYGGSWTLDTSNTEVGNYGQPFLGMQQMTTSSGSTLIFPFEGMGVQVYGRWDTSGQGDTQDPTWECFIDGISIGAGQAPPTSPQNNWILCQKPSLSAGSHQLVVRVKKNTRTFWFDYAVYTPTPNVSLASVISKIPFTDPMFQLDDSWDPLGTGAKLTADTGSIASFEFIGKAVYWYGWTINEWAHGSSSAAYTLDDKPPVSFVLKGLDPGPQSTKFFVLFFSVEGLTNGPHRLSVKFTGTHEQTPLTLSHVNIVNGTQVVPGLPSSSPSSTSTPPKTSTPAVDPSHRSPNAGAIVAGVLGSVAFVLALTAAFIWWRRNRSTSRTLIPYKMVPAGPSYAFTQEQPQQGTLNSTFAYPLGPVARGFPDNTFLSPHGYAALAPRHSMHKSRAGPLPGTQNTTASGGWGSYHSAYPLSGHHRSYPSGSSSSLPSSLPPGHQYYEAGSSTDLISTQVVVHRDSGVRLNSNSSRSIELPPQYTHE